MNFDPNRYAYNSRFRPISKKRAEQIANGTYKPKPRKPLRTMSVKAKQRSADYSAASESVWGARCFLCGRDKSQTKLDHHHIDGRVNGDDPMRIVPLCNRFCGCKCHDHNGFADPRTRELNAEIEEKMKQMGVIPNGGQY